MQIIVFLTKGREGYLNESLVLAILNCRSLNFEIKSIKRIAITLRAYYNNSNSGIISRYIRLRLGDLFSAKLIKDER